MNFSLVGLIIRNRFEFVKGFCRSSLFTLNRLLINEKNVNRLFPNLESRRLRTLFNHFGSDKSSEHDYEIFYSQILQSLPSGDLLEIGIGTNNPNMNSTMGKSGKPGASLFAWQECQTFQQIFGTDIDKDILFNDQIGIQTFYLDQTDISDLRRLKMDLGSRNLSMIIDDGLHEVFANITAFQELWEILLPGGAYCIEDVKQSDLIPLIVGLAPYLKEFQWCVYQNYHRKIDNAILCIRKIKSENF